MESVGIAELKAGLSAYLERVRAAEDILVTGHESTVARLAPVTRAESQEDKRLWWQGCSRSDKL